MKKSTPFLSTLLVLPTVIFAATAPNGQKVETPQEVVEITLPTPPTPPKPVIVRVNNNNKSQNATTSHAIQFSKRTPPNYKAGGKLTLPKEKISTLVGSIDHGKVAAYLRGAYMDTKEATAKLKAAGFEVIATVPIDKDGDLTTLVFTNDTLKEMASKPKREFAASLRLLIDSRAKQISITNPLYVTKAFLQEDFDKEKATKLLEALNNAFDTLKNSKDALKFQLLPKYRFMDGMPTYNDMFELEEGSDLLARLKANKKLLFEQKLDNGAIIAGVKLSEATNSFPQQIGTQNAALLPYPVLIEENKAYIMDPKYYISVMYPNLKMSEFMKIMNVPDDIIKECRHAF